MFCQSCSKLAYLFTKKKCVRCQADVLHNISVLCDKCSATSKQCAACLKKYDPRPPSKGCGCGGK